MDNNGPQIRLFVRDQKPKALAATVPAPGPIWQITAAVETKTGGPADELFLSHGGHKLDNDRASADYGLENDNTLTLALHH